MDVDSLVNVLSAGAAAGANTAPTDKVTHAYSQVAKWLVENNTQTENFAAFERSNSSRARSKIARHLRRFNLSSNPEFVSLVQKLAHALTDLPQPDKARIQQVTGVLIWDTEATAISIFDVEHGVDLQQNKVSGSISVGRVSTRRSKELNPLKKTVEAASASRESAATGIGLVGNTARIIAVAENGNVTVNESSLTVRQHQNALDRQTEQFRRMLESLHGGDGERRLEIEAQLRAAEDKRANAEADLARIVQDYQKMVTELNELKRQVPAEQLEEGMRALRDHDIRGADLIFAAAEERANADGARAAYQRGVLAEGAIQFAEAIAHYRRAVQYQPDNAHYSTMAGLLAHKMGRFAEAEPLYLRAVEIREKEPLHDRVPLAQSLNNLGGLQRDLGQSERAKEFFNRALALLYDNDGVDDKEVARTLNNLGGVYYDEGRSEESRKLFSRALEIRHRLFGEMNAEVATTLNNLAETIGLEGQSGEAEEYHKRALKIRESILGLRHPDVAQSRNNLGCLYLDQGRADEAEEMFCRAIEVDKQVWGDMHPRIAIDLSNLADAFRVKGKYPEAILMLQEAENMANRALGERHPITRTIKGNLEFTLKAEVSERLQPDSHSLKSRWWFR